MKRTLMILLAICVISSLASAQVHSRKAIKGVWKVAEIVVTGTNPGAVNNPQPGLVIFGRKYYSMAYVPSDQERPIYAGPTPTQEEKAAAFDSIIVNAGVYELSGATLTVRPAVARNPGFTKGAYARYRIRIVGKTMWLSSKNGDFVFRIGDKLAPLSGPPNETRIKLTRLE